MSDNHESRLDTLRQKAEARLGDLHKSMEGLSPDELKVLIHDYQVHRIELELQNEELREAQNQLQAARDRFTRLFNDAPVGYLTIDSNGMICQVNQTFASMIGREPYHLTGRPLAQFISSEDRSAFHGRFRAFFKNPTGKKMEFGLQSTAKDLRVRCVGRMESTTHTQPESPKPRHLLLVVIDVSEQVRAERRQLLMARILGILNNSQSLAHGISQILESIQEETGVDACGIRLRKGQDFPYYVHHGFSREFLDAENTLLARDAHGDVCRNAHGEPDLECTCGLVLTGQTDPSNPLFTPNGSCWTNDSFPLLDLPENQDPRFQPRNTCIHQGYQSVALVPVRADQEIVGLLQLNDRRKNFFDKKLINFLEEISSSIGVALMRLQDAQMIKDSEERLRALLNEKDKFFSIIAHDLKSPMSGLLSLSSVLADNAHSLTREELQEAASAMFKSSEQLYALLENLLHWALMQQGMMGFAPGSQSLRGVVQAGMEPLQSVSSQKDVALRNLVPEQMLTQVDVPMVSTVLRNLISNALKFTDRGGSVIVSASRDGDMVKVAVQDTGLGMEQDSLDQIFTLGKKKVGAGTRGETGTGLGLVLCKEFIEKHGGQIWLESEPGQGTTVFFTLPAAPKDTAENKAKKQAVGTGPTG